MTKRGYLPHRVPGETGKAGCQYGKEMWKDDEGAAGLGAPLGEGAGERPGVAF